MRVFVVELDRKAVTFAVVRPSAVDEQEGGRVYARAWREAVLPDDGRPVAFLRADLDRVARERGVWDDARQVRENLLVQRLRTGAKVLAAGGIRLSAARVIATVMHTDRQELRRLREGRDRLLEMTAEGRAEQAEFDYLVAVCTRCADTGERYFAGVEEMLARDDDPVVLTAGRELAALLHGHDPDFALKLPEATFLLSHGFATVEDGQLRLHHDTTQRAATAH